MLDIAYLRRHNKKILAFFGVFLMIAFILPSTTKSGRDYQKGEFGKAYGEAISISEHSIAISDLKVLKERLALGRDFGYIEISLAQRLMGYSGNIDFNQLMSMFNRNPYVIGEARRISERIDAISFALLLREARRMNVAPLADQVEEVLARFAPTKGQDLPAEETEWRKQALTDWLTIMAAFDRMTEASRMSSAMATWDAANASQQASLQLIDFRAVDFEKAAGKPTEDQLAAFFKTNENQDRETSENGIGYRFPNRVKLQYVKISKAEAIKSVTKDDAAEYWYNHQNEFVRLPDEPTTQPTTKSTTQPTSKPAAQAASTQPSTRPWVEGNDIDKEIRKMLAEQRMAAIAKAVQTRMSAEWPTFLEAVRAEKKPIPEKAPLTDYGFAYHKFGFLTRLCEKVQTLKESHNVLPEAHEMGEFYSASELKERTDVGKAIISGNPLPQYLMTFLEPFLSDKTRKQAADMKIPTLRVLEPARFSTPALDAEGNIYIVRVLEAEPARPARDLNEVRAQVEKDWLLVESLKKAKEAAEKFLAVAKDKGVGMAAKQQGIEGRVVQTDTFANRPSEKIGKYELPDAAREKLIQGTFDLLQKQVSTGEPNPVGLIDLPKASRVVVAQLATSKPAEGGFELELRAMQTQMQYSAMRTGALLNDWFDSANLHKRTKYQPDPRLGKSNEE